MKRLKTPGARRERINNKKSLKVPNFLVFDRSYKYRIYPNDEQIKQLDKLFGSYRFVYNSILSEYLKRLKNFNSKNEQLQRNKELFSRYNLRCLIDDPLNVWLKDIPFVILKNAEIIVKRNLRRYIRGITDIPKLLTKKSTQYVNFVDINIKINKNELSIFGLPGNLLVKFHRPLISDTRSCMISKKPSGEYFIVFKVTENKKITSGKGVLGIDAGIKNLYTFSNGEIVENPRFYVKAKKKLNQLKEDLYKSIPGSNNWERKRIKYAKKCAKIANQRKDFAHKLSTRIVRENQAIVIETLSIQELLRKRNGLAEHILDAAWGGFYEKLEYKCQQSNTKLIYADRYFKSTQICSNCGCVSSVKLGLSVRNWTCIHCGSKHDRDINAAQNLKLLGERNLEKFGLSVNAVMRCSIDD